MSYKFLINQNYLKEGVFGVLVYMLTSHAEGSQFESGCRLGLFFQVWKFVWPKGQSDDFYPITSYIWGRGEYWPGKNHKYFRKRKLFMEYQSIFFKIFWLEKFVLIL
jgi:hypothetical protein